MILLKWKEHLIEPKQNKKIQNKSTVLFSIGSNLGNRIENILKAIKLLSIECSTDKNNISSYYETEPFGNSNQDWFINIALLAETELSPTNLLFFCKTIEFILGRKSAPIWSERIIDIDILLFDDLILDTPFLQIPHKHMLDRKFVLMPCAEIAGCIIHPIANKKISDLNLHCEDKCVVRKI